jgi:retron-type reverse transcriptase
VHRLLYDYLVPLVDPKFDYDVWSCRTGKGLHQALLRTKHLTTKYRHGWVWRADITKSFDNVDQKLLKTHLARFVSDKEALNLLVEVIKSYPTDLITSEVGIPIGNLTSQIFANVYLNELDRFVRHHINPLGYIRYGDDFVLFVNRKEEAEYAKNAITTWLLDVLHLKVHPNNNLAVKTSSGLLFLGHQIYPTSRVSIDKAMTKKLKQRLDRRNAGSYRAMYLPKKLAKRFPWMLRERI